MKIKISDIIIFNRKRKTDPQKVSELAESIKRLGLLNPITISQNGDLIAGHHRVEAYKLLGLDQIEALVKDFNDFKKELAEIDENLIRNELSVLEQGEMIVERDELLSSMSIRAKSGSNRGANFAPLTNGSIASEMGISKRTLLERKQIARNIVPEVKDKLRGTRYADTAYGLMQLARQPEHIQKIAIKKIFAKESSHKFIKVDSNEINIIKKSIFLAHREHSCEKHIKQSKEFKVPEHIQIYHGDFRRICATDIPNGSIDLVLTDPPYKAKTVSLFKDLAETSYHLLRPSGFLISYLGTINIPEAINYFQNAGLEYHWTGVVKFKDCRAQIWNRRIWSYVRYFLVFYKPPRTKNLKYFEDFIVSGGKEKDFHIFQQSIKDFRYLVSKFSEKGDTILDPFGGSGTTAIASHEEGRKCIIIEKEKKSVALIKSRIAGYFEKGNAK